MSAQHTPGPWGTAPNWPRGMTAVCWHTGTGWQLVATAQTEADAERIVQCVNAHDELVAGLEKAVAEIERAWRVGVTHAYCPDWIVHKGLKELIAKASGSAA
jgi:hypothetical protein